MKLKVRILLYVAVTVLIGMGVLFTVNFFTLKKNMFSAEVAKARSFVLAAEGVREFMGLASAADVYKTDELVSDINRLLLTVPIVGAMKTMELKSEEAGLKFKVPKISPRNPINEPDETDLMALKELDKLDQGSQTKTSPEFVYHDKENEQLRYYKAIRLSEVCEKCHGDPATSQALWGNSEGKDPTGVKMENWRAGELHGAFEVYLPTAPVYAAIYKNLLVSFLVFLPVTIVILIILYLINSRYIFNRVQEVGDALSRIAAGDFTVRMQVTHDDEVGDLVKATNKMTADVNDALMIVTDSISSIASTAAELSSNAETIAHGAMEQSGQVAATASAVEEVSSTVIEVAQNASNVSRSAEDASNSVAQGHRLVEETRNMMEQIAMSVSESAVTVRKLGESSEQIGQIIQVIDDIADQTNLLALNAAIEAARAGEHGRGFAVVADEVRKLAEKTVKATQEIADMIQSIQADTGGAVAGMHEGVMQVENGKTKAEEAKEALDIIKMNVQNVSNEVGMIARATEEQASATEMMAQSIENISHVTSENSNASQETAKAVEQLSHLANDLQGLIHRFKTGK